MNIFSNNLIEILNEWQVANVVFIVFLSMCIITFLLRILLCIGYQIQFTHFAVKGKPISRKDDIKINYFGLLNKVISDYVRVANSGIYSIDTRAIIDKHIVRINFLGLSFSSIEKLVLSVEKNILFMAILLTFAFEEYRALYGFIGVVVFCCTNIFTSMFDFPLLKQKLSSELCVYIESEVGKFFGLDVSRVFENSIDELSKVLIGQLQEINASVHELNRILDKMKESYSIVDVTNTALQSQMKYIEDNQNILEQSMNKYEIALEDITRKTGDALGKMLEFHVQNSYNALDESLKQNIKQIIGYNSELIRKFEQLFAQLNEQSRVQTETLVKFREELNNELLKN